MQVNIINTPGNAINQLPIDIHTTILNMLPAKDLTTCRLVMKLWQSLIDKPGSDLNLGWNACNLFHHLKIRLIKEIRPKHDCYTLDDKDHLMTFPQINTLTSYQIPHFRDIRDMILLKAKYDPNSAQEWINSYAAVVTYPVTSARRLLGEVIYTVALTDPKRAKHLLKEFFPKKDDKLYGRLGMRIAEAVREFFQGNPAEVDKVLSEDIPKTFSKLSSKCKADALQNMALEISSVNPEKSMEIIFATSDIKGYTSNGRSEVTHFITRLLKKYSRSFSSKEAYEELKAVYFRLKAQFDKTPSVEKEEVYTYLHPLGIMVAFHYIQKTIKVTDLEILCDKLDTIPPVFFTNIYVDSYRLSNTGFSKILNNFKKNINDVSENLDGCRFTDLEVRNIIIKHKENLTYLKIRYKLNDQLESLLKQPLIVNDEKKSMMESPNGIYRSITWKTNNLIYLQPETIFKVIYKLNQLSQLKSSTLASIAHHYQKINEGKKDQEPLGSSKRELDDPVSEQKAKRERYEDQNGKEEV